MVFQNLIEMTSNIIDIVAFGVAIKCPRKIHMNTQCPPLRHANVLNVWSLFLKIHKTFHLKLQVIFVKSEVL